MNHKRQGGATLIIALMFLIVLTLLGVAGSHNAIVQERMAGASRDRSVAFQAAELALRSGEALAVKQNPLIYDASCTNGYCSMGNGQDWSDSELWNQSNPADGKYAAVATASTALATLDPPLAADPKFRAEYLGVMPCKGCDQGMSDVFRVYSHGAGSRLDTESNLSSTIRP